MSDGALQLPRELQLPVTRIELGNGLRVLLLENHAAPAVAVSALIRAGERNVEDAKAGLGTLAGEMLLEGTARRSAREIAAAIEARGGALGISGGEEATSVNLTLLGEDLPLGLELAAELVREPIFALDRLALTVDRRLAQLRAHEDDPRWVASTAFNEIVFAGTPRHRPPLGYGETISLLSRHDLVSYHERHFAPDNALMIVVGDFQTADAAARCEALFGDWRRSVDPAPPVASVFAMQSGPRVKHIRKEKEQVNILLGHLGIRRSAPDYHAVRVLDTILGDSPGFTSRIPRLLRDEHGLAYTVYCNMARSAGLDPGRFVAYIGTAPENLERAVALLREQIELIVKEPPSDEEVEEAKSYLVGSHVFEFETNAQVAAFLASVELYDLGPDYPRRYVDEIGRVEAEDVWRAARAHIHPEALTLVVVGPVEEMEE